MKSTIFFIFLVTSILLMFFGMATAHDTVWPGDKLEKLAPEAISFEQKNLYLSDVQKKTLRLSLMRNYRERISNHLSISLLPGNRLILRPAGWR